jgi:hypothetical protein
MTSQASLGNIDEEADIEREDSRGGVIRGMKKLNLQTGMSSGVHTSSMSELTPLADEMGSEHSERKFLGA